MAGPFTGTDATRYLGANIAWIARTWLRKAKVVELSYFGGLSEEEIVAVLKISPRTVKRDGTSPGPGCCIN